MAMLAKIRRMFLREQRSVREIARMGGDNHLGRPGVVGVDPSVGSFGDSYDNSLTETLIGLPQRHYLDSSVRGWQRAQQCARAAE